jgi:hypothetical protein
MTKPKTLKREELYDLVWSLPMIKLAKRFDLSDQGLVKKCKKHNIPRPKMGYWAKLEHGKTVKKTPLPSSTDQALELIEFNPRFRSVLHGPETNPLTKDPAFQIPKRVHSYHPLIKEYRKLKNSKLLDQYGRLIFRNISVDMGLKVTPGTFNRACLFLQGIIKFFDSYDWVLEKDTGYRGDANYGVFVFEGEKLRFELKEPVTQIPDEITNLKRKDGVSWPTKEYTPSGTLEFSIEGTHWRGLQTRWKDTTKEKLENRVSSIVQGFKQAFEYSKLQTIKKEARDLAWEQRVKSNQELLRLKELEEARRNHLFELTQAFDRATSIRNLVSAFKGSENKEEGFDKWLEWATKIADELDPVDKQAEVLARFHQIETEEF